MTVRLFNSSSSKYQTSSDTAVIINILLLVQRVLENKLLQWRFIEQVNKRKIPLNNTDII